MWIFFREGYVSVVQHKEDALKLLVRARRHEHLVALFNNVSRLIDPSRIEYTPEADYHYRVTVSKNILQVALSIKVDTIDYTSFKKSITDKLLRGVALDIWEILWDAYRRKFK